MALPGRKFLPKTGRANEVNDRILGVTIPEGTFIVGDVTEHQQGTVSYNRVALHDCNTEAKQGYCSDSRVFGLTAIYREVNGKYERVPREEMSSLTNYDQLKNADCLRIVKLEGDFFSRQFKDSKPVLDEENNPVYQPANAYFIEVATRAGEEKAPSTAKKKGAKKEATAVGE